MPRVYDDSSPTARALLALELLQGSPGITAERLGDRLGVSERAARRYVAILREAGVPIESVRGPYGGYRVGRGPAAAAADVHGDRGPRPGDGGARGARCQSGPAAGTTRWPARSARSSGSCPRTSRDRSRRCGTWPHGVPTPTRRTPRPPPPWSGPAPTSAGSGSATPSTRTASEPCRSTRGPSWSGTAGGTCSAGRTRPTPGGSTASTGSDRSRCWTTRSPRRPTSSRSAPSRNSSRRAGSIRSRWRSTLRSRRCVAGCRAASARTEAIDDERTRLTGTTDNLDWYATEIAEIQATFTVVGGPEIRAAVGRLARRLADSIS